MSLSSENLCDKVMQQTDMQTIAMQLIGEGNGLHRRGGPYPKPRMAKGSRGLGRHSLNLHPTRVNVSDMRNIPTTALSMSNAGTNPAH